MIIVLAPCQNPGWHWLALFSNCICCSSNFPMTHTTKLHNKYKMLLSVKGFHTKWKAYQRYHGYFANLAHLRKKVELAKGLLIIDIYIGELGSIKRLYVYKQKAFTKRSKLCYWHSFVIVCINIIFYLSLEHYPEEHNVLVIHNLNGWVSNNLCL